MLLLAFTIDANRYAVDAARVIEVVPRVRLRTAPLAPGYLAGLLSYRGRIVPILELGLLIGSDRCRDRLATRILLVDATPARLEAQPAREPHERVVMGLVAEQASDLLKVESNDLIPAPVRLPNAPFLGPIVRQDRGQILQLIEVEKLPAMLVGQAVMADPVPDSPDAAREPRS